MTSSDGPFYSTQDADSEGVEGKFFVWSRAEIERILGKEEAELFCSIYDVTAEGNWEEHNILHRDRTDEQETRLLRVPVDELRRRLGESRRRLFQEREKRTKPGLDDKVLTSWNALMISAFASAAQVLDRADYADRAAAAADYLLTGMRRPDGRLYRTTRIGGNPALNGYLEDYAYLIDALITLYEATFAPRWIVAARELTDVMFEQFWDDADGGLFYTGKDHEQLIARGKDPHDNATPSGNGVAVTALLRLGKLTGDRRILDPAEQTLRLFRGIMAQHPMAAGQMLIALDFQLGPVDEIVVVGDRDNTDVHEALALLRGRFRPNQMIAHRPTDAKAAADAEQAIPLLVGRTSQGTVTTYICRQFTCEAPVVGVDALKARLAEKT